MATISIDLLQRWESLPNPIKFLLSGTVVGVSGNYATRGLDYVFALYSGGSISLLAQFTIVVFGLLLFFDTLHKARINRLMESLEGI